MPTEEAPFSDQSRILMALDALGYEHVNIPPAHPADSLSHVPECELRHNRDSCS